MTKRFFNGLRLQARIQDADNAHAAGAPRREARESLKRQVALKREECERLRRGLQDIRQLPPVIDAMPVDGGAEVRQFAVERADDIEKQEALISKAEQELVYLTRLAAVEDLAYAQWIADVQPLIALRAACEKYIEKHKLAPRHVPIADVPLDVAPAVARAKVQTIRQQIAAQRSDRAAAQSAPCSEAEALAAIEGAVSSLRDVDPAQAIGPAHLVMRYLLGREDAAPALATFLADQLHEQLVAEVGNFYAAKGPGLSVDERAARIAAADAQILALEIEEEQLVRGMIAAGLQIQRRPDADPAVVLDVRPAAESEEAAV